MKCPICRGPMKTMRVYGITYHRCSQTGLYFTDDFKRIENITEYKNKIRRESLKKYYHITNIENENKKSQ